jgi:predicted nucleic acid-binding protein
MLLCDTGPLVAFVDADDAHHKLATQSLAQLAAEQLITTWPCLTEALYLLRKFVGHDGQDKLLQFVENRILLILPIEQDLTLRIRALMKKYHDAPMDFADASLVVAAEVTNNKRVFSFDSHFRTYLIHDRIPFEVIP